MNSSLTLLLLCTNLKKIHVNNHKNLCHQMYCLKFGSKCQIPLFRNLKEVGFKRKRKLKRKLWLKGLHSYWVIYGLWLWLFSLKTRKKKTKTWWAGPSIRVAMSPNICNILTQCPQIQTPTTLYIVKS